MTPRMRRVAASVIGAVVVAAALVSTAPAASAAPTAPLTNLAHLDFLLDEATPPADVAGHTTYRLDEEPTLVMPWTYADAREGGEFERIGGGTLDPATGDWTQGAYNADDIARAAVVYLRHWQLTGDADSRDKAYETLRATAYLQTVDGPNAGNVVLWMQPDGTLNPSAEPIELPDPSDSGPSYWLARSVWAFGEGYAAFAEDDPEFAAFLRDRLDLALGALERDVLVDAGQWEYADGARVPAWLIVDGADASAEASLGLAAAVSADPSYVRAADALRWFARGIAAMSAGDTRTWPYGAILPWTQARSMWHAWASQMPAALVAASDALDAGWLLTPARIDGAGFTPTLLTAGGADNGWYPSPTDRVQIAYGVDSRVQSLSALADATGSDGFTALAAMQAAWYFGVNHAGEAMYNPATGVTFDGLQADGTVNRNSGAESAIHGLLTMLVLDSRPALRDRALSFGSITAQSGLRLVEAETAATTGGVVTAPESWTGESSWSGGALVLDAGSTARFDIGSAATAQSVAPVVFTEPGERSTSVWTAGTTTLGRLRDSGPAQGVSPTAGLLRPETLPAVVPAGEATATVRVQQGTLTLDALIVRPALSTLELAGAAGATRLVQASSTAPQSVSVQGRFAVYDRFGAPVRSGDGTRTVWVPAGGFAVVG